MRTLRASFLQMGNTWKSACTKSFSWLEVIMSAYINHCLSKGKYDNEVALACSVNALFFYPLCRCIKNVIHNTLY